ncbi:hypothetical protein ATE84_2878 [Aquimarina sp. MAR_2010_214]|uniref:hypothetical protein n=1 Tax=Aquimarina sp. MAR_2010_214 TaxID=1250026 RepID=UPI000C700374|nr:hypothetical protein [Aquimarina sp. MAR_2010_214]PKV50811.1 hypothetical protein ATE84_2878 [Aquimarina sp. MAR_2010_214]
MAQGEDIYLGNAKPHWRFDRTLVWSIDIKELIEILQNLPEDCQYKFNGKMRTNLHITKRKNSVESGSTHFIKVDTYVKTH